MFSGQYVAQVIQADGHPDDEGRVIYFTEVTDTVRCRLATISTEERATLKTEADVSTVALLGGGVEINHADFVKVFVEHGKVLLFRVDEVRRLGQVHRVFLSNLDTYTDAEIAFGLNRMEPQPDLSEPQKLHPANRVP